MMKLGFFNTCAAVHGNTILNLRAALPHLEFLNMEIVMIIIGMTTAEFVKQLQRDGVFFFDDSKNIKDEDIAGIVSESPHLFESAIQRVLDRNPSLTEEDL